MSLRVAVQMDPLDRINIEGDSTFAIMLGAQARGHSLCYYSADWLSYAEGRLWTMAHPVTVQRVAGDHYRLGDEVQGNEIRPGFLERRILLAQSHEAESKSTRTKATTLPRHCCRSP